MSTHGFNIAVVALSTVAQRILADPSLLSACSVEGAKPSDWQELVDYGLFAESADLQQQAAQQRITVSQDALEEGLSSIERSINDLKIRKKAIYSDLFSEGASQADLLFVERLSFAMRAAAPKPDAERSKSAESTAQDARALQLSRMASEILQRPAVAKAFAERGIEELALQKMIALSKTVSEARKQRDQNYKEWIEAGAWERASVAKQSQVWDRIRLGVARVSKHSLSIKALLEYLKGAKERAKTGKKLGPRTPQPQASASLPPLS